METAFRVMIMRGEAMIDIPAHIAALQERLGAEAGRLGVTPPTLRNSTKHYAFELDITFQGWSPTLHLMHHHERFDIIGFVEDVLPCSDDEAAAMVASIEAYDLDVTARVILENLRFDFEEQQLRTAAAAQHGIHSPITDLTDVRHMHIDRDVRDRLVVAGHGPIEIVRRVVRQLHGDPYGMDNLMSLDGRVYGVDADLRHDFGQMPLPMVSIMLPIREGVEYDGRSLGIANVELPDTVRDAAVGRPLGEMVDMPHYADRIVEGVERWVTFHGSSGSLGKTSPYGNPLSEADIPVLKIWLQPEPVPVDI